MWRVVAAAVGGPPVGWLVRIVPLAPGSPPPHPRSPTLVCGTRRGVGPCPCACSWLGSGLNGAQPCAPLLSLYPFQELDKDGSGSITAEELLSYFDVLVEGACCRGQALRAPPPGLTTAAPNPLCLPPPPLGWCVPCPSSPSEDDGSNGLNYNEFADEHPQASTAQPAEYVRAQLVLGLGCVCVCACSFAVCVHAVLPAVSLSHTPPPHPAPT